MDVSIAFPPSTAVIDEPLPRWQVMIFSSSIGFPSTLASCALTFVIAWMLIHFTDSTVPWADAFTTALSVVGMWMLARKYLEQWWVWLIVDVACVALYIYKYLHFTAALYALYAIVAIFGYRKWKQLMTTQYE